MRQVGWPWDLKTGERIAGRKNKSSEVVSDPFVSASSSLIDPCLTCLSFVFADCAARSSAWAPGSPPTGQTYPTPRNSILPSTCLLGSPRPALCYRPLLAFLPNLAARKVTSLEPRTPHQPEKLKKLSKNDLVVLLLFSESIKNRDL